MSLSAIPSCAVDELSNRRQQQNVFAGGVGLWANFDLEKFRVFSNIDGNSKYDLVHCTSIKIVKFRIKLCGLHVSGCSCGCAIVHFMWARPFFRALCGRSTLNVEYRWYDEIHSAEFLSSIVHQQEDKTRRAMLHFLRICKIKTFSVNSMICLCKNPSALAVRN